MSPLDMGKLVALYADVNTVDVVEVPTFAAPAVAPGRSVARDQYGRPMVVPPDGGPPCPYTRASSEAGYLTDGNALRVWQTRRLALALARFPDLLLRVAVLDPEAHDDTPAELERAKDDKGQLDELIERALDRDGTLGKADWGTALHKLSEPGVSREYAPAEALADLAAYDEALESRGIVRVESEVFVVNDDVRVSGTTDGVFDVPGWGRMVGDLKTGQLHPVQHAVQLAAYAGGTRYRLEGGTWQRFGGLDVRDDVALLIHLLKGSGTCELYLIDLEHGRRSLALAERVRDARRSAGLARPFDAVEAPELEDAAAAQADGSVKADLALGAGLGPDLQREAQARRARDEARADAQADAEAPMHAKVRTAADVRADVEATARATARATAYVEHPVADTVLDVHGRPVELKGDGFDGVRVSDPVEAAGDVGVARGLIADALGGRELTPAEELADHIARAVSRDAVNALWAKHAPLGEWTEEHHELARQRVALLGPAPAAQ